jgi:hypothetical protein
MKRFNSRQFRTLKPDLLCLLSDTGPTFRSPVIDEKATPTEERQWAWIVEFVQGHKVKNCVSPRVESGREHVTCCDRRQSSWSKSCLKLGKEAVRSDRRTHATEVGGESSSFVSGVGTKSSASLIQQVTFDCSGETCSLRSDISNS